MHRLWSLRLRTRLILPTLARQEDKASRNPNHHRVMLALTTAFWDAYVHGDADALAWLNGAGPRSIMEAADRRQFAPN